MTTSNPHTLAQQAAYERDAEAFERAAVQRSRTYQRKAEFLLGRIATPAGQRVRILEVGCGTAILTKIVAERLGDRGELWATDTFEGVIALARGRCAGLSNVHVERVDPNADGTAGMGFDALIGCDIVHHLENPVSVAAAWRRSLRPGARLLLLESNPRNPVLFARCYGRPEESRFFLNSPEFLKQVFEDAGFEKVSVEYMPLYLPSTPRSLESAAGSLENMLHRRIPSWQKCSGLMLVDASA